MEVVTAEGKRGRASAEENVDLFWTLRGGGGNFGIVTLFEYQLHEVGPNVLAGLIVFPGTGTKSVLAQYRDFAATMPDDLTIWGISLPNAWLADHKGQNLIEFASDEIGHSSLAAGIEQLRVAPGEIILTLAD